MTSRHGEVEYRTTLCVFDGHFVAATYSTNGWELHQVGSPVVLKDGRVGIPYTFKRAHWDGWNRENEPEWARRG